MTAAHLQPLYLVSSGFSPRSPSPLPRWSGAGRATIEVQPAPGIINVPPRSFHSLAAASSRREGERDRTEGEREQFRCQSAILRAVAAVEL